MGSGIFSDLTVTSCRSADLGTHAALLKFWELVVLGTDWSLPGNHHLKAPNGRPSLRVSTFAARALAAKTSQFLATSLSFL
eukprot:s2701_g4.t1